MPSTSYISPQSMTPNTMDSEHYFAPPPAYFEQEFDQKISHATNLSVQTAQLERRAAEGGGWEPYDPKAFEGEVTRTSKTAPAQVDQSKADTTTTSWQTNPSSVSVNEGVPAAQNHSADGPNNSPSVQPLRIEKKSAPKSNALDVQGPHATINYSAASSTSAHRKSSLSVSSPFSTPTSFADQVNARISAAIPNSEGVQPEGKTEEYRHSLVDPYYTTHATSPRQSLPPPIRPHVAVPERPMSYSPSSSSPSPSVPRIDFNPYVAYGNRAPTSLPVQTPPRRPMAPEISYDPNAFYNSAVSAQLTPSRPSQPYPSPLSGGNLPQYQVQNASYLQDGVQQQPFNSPLRPVRPPVHGVNNSPRQALWQSSTRPATSYGGSDLYLVPESNRHPNNRNSVYSNHSNR